MGSSKSTSGSVLAPLLLFAAGVQTEGYELPEGFRVERAADVAASFVALCFEPGQPVGLPAGGARALISHEDGGLTWLEDRDGDGFFEESGDYTDRIRACQGMTWKEGLLYAVGSVDGALGLFRLTPSTSGRGVRDLDLVAAVAGELTEHGPHGVAVGADGMFYLLLGDQVRMASEPRGRFPLLAPGRADNHGLVAVLHDPNGHGQEVAYPCGYVARIDPATGEWDYHSVGYRNPYDLAFDEDGELFTFDSDMEWDVGLPWYRPTRFLQCVPGGDYGWRPGSGVWPDYYFDVLPPALEAGRGSPTGLAFCNSGAFPMRYRGALFAGDWTEGRILAFFPRAAGAAHGGEIETVVRTDAGLPVTDLAFGPSGDLYFVSGGRGTIGRFERLAYSGQVEPLSLRPARQPTWIGRAVTPEMLTDPDPVVVRRALESLLFEHSVPQDLAPLALARLDDPDRWIRFAAYQLARKHGLAAAEVELPSRAEVLLAAATGGEATWEPSAPGGDEALLDFLRARQVLLPSKGTFGDADVLSLFPHRDWRVSREVARILGQARPAGSVERLLSALEAEQDTAQQIHYAYCLTMPGDGLRAEGEPAEGFSDSQARRLLRWFDQAENWTGGISFGGHLAAMRTRLTARFDPERRLQLALEAPKSERLGLRTVAHFTRDLELEQVERLVPAIQYGWGQAGEGDRRAALRVLAGVRAPSLLAFLRRQCDNPEAPTEEVLAALASSAEEEDWARFVEGLDARSRETAEACAQALTTLERRPDGSEPFRTALDLARRHGPNQGLAFLRLFIHWTGQELPPAAPDDWDGALAGQERWGTLTFPEFRRGDVDDSRRPVWSYEATRTFLEASRERPGSAERGAEVYRKAACASCHVVGERAWPELTGFGPDLHGVSSRFPLEGLLESIWFPSKAIAEPYRTSLATTTVGLRIEGRVVSQDDDLVVLKRADGTPVTLEWSVIESLQESSLSTMPEGLLAPLTLEEVKDLFAFLAADGVTRGSAAEAPEAGWMDLLDEHGRNLWEGDLELWKIRGGVLVGRSKGLEQSAYLVSKPRFDDFELEFDVRFTDGLGNGGLQYRSSVRADRPDPLGYQVDLGETYWGSLYASDGRNELAGPEDALWREVVDRDGWNHVYLRADGDQHQIELNGRRMVDLRDAAFTYGVLAFQLHAGPESEVRYTNARLRPLR